MAICLFSLAGIPPLVGFWGKFEIFASALAAQRRDESRSFLVLAVIGVLNAAIGAYYYLRIVVVMYLTPAEGGGRRSRGGWPVAASVAACASLTVVLGIVLDACRGQRPAPPPDRPWPIPHPPAPQLPRSPARMGFIECELTISLAPRQWGEGALCILDFRLRISDCGMRGGVSSPSPRGSGERVPEGRVRGLSIGESNRPTNQVCHREV